MDLAGYTIVSELGSGDFSAVYEVSTDSSDEHFAMKVSRAVDTRSAARLSIETIALQQLDIDATPSYIDSGSEGDYQYLVVSMAPGTTIAEQVRENQTRGEYFSALRTMEIISTLLEILCNMSRAPHVKGTGRGWVHRDIKAANILSSASGSVVTLIDFGFCKEDGSTEKRTDDSFFRAGAARYAPPYKHKFPTHARASHDVFAVGVLAYLMLTNEYPWSSTESDGEGNSPSR